MVSWKSGSKSREKINATSWCLTDVAPKLLAANHHHFENYIGLPSSHHLRCRTSTVTIAVMADSTEEPSKNALKKAAKEAKMAADKAVKAAKQAAMPIVGGKKTDDIIGITVTKAENFPIWYQEVVLKAEMIEYYNEISGFFILRPISMFVWNEIRKWFQGHIEEMGVEEASFPMFLSSKSLEKEKDHVEGFAPELAWVTKA